MYRVSILSFPQNTASLSHGKTVSANIYGASRLSSEIKLNYSLFNGPGSSVGIATGYGLDGLGI
jgi:hypothetical protein